MLRSAAALRQPSRCACIGAVRQQPAPATAAGGRFPPTRAMSGSDDGEAEAGTPSRAQVGASRRVVVKMGTAVVTHDGVEIALGRVTSIVEQIANWQRRGIQPVLVSSGSIGLGSTTLGFTETPKSLGKRQACAAVGQGLLIGFYTQAFAQLGVKVAQVLLTNEDLADRDRALCLRTTLLRLIEMGVVPVINENDSVSVRELLEVEPNTAVPTAVAFGDNDGLSARVATAIDADLLVLLTDVDGVFTSNPTVDPEAKLVSRLSIEELVEIDTAGAGSKGGTGGMGSKVGAAEWACSHGVTTLIANGRKHSTLRRAMLGEDVGTVVFPPAEQQRWRNTHVGVMQGRCHGQLILNGAACRTLQSGGKLLPENLTSIGGDDDFQPGDVVELVDEIGRVVGKGFANYSSEDCKSIAGVPSDQISTVLGWRGYDTIVSKENMLLADRFA